MGDKALFGGKTTDDMKKRFGVKKRPLADFLPNVTLKAKDLATAMTTEVSRKKNLRGTDPICNAHYESNASVRGALVKTNIFPEELPPAEDIKKIETRHRKQRAELEKQQKKELREATKNE
ncbi:MAG: hypothetical protein Q8P93_01680 [bacterium]|nr:hypothetical protein [bacterium]